MKPSTLRMKCVIAAISLMALVQCGNNEKTTVRIYGSTTIEPIIKRATQEYGRRSNTHFVINAVGSKSGIDSLIEGACDIAISSMEIAPEQITRAKEKAVSLKPFLLGYDVIVPIVHPSNPISDITCDQLKEIYAGLIHRWSAMGGADTVIDVVERAVSSGTYCVWHHDVMPPQEKADSFTVRASNSAVLAYIAEHTNAIGYISAAYLNPEVKPLKLNGIAIAENDSLLSEYHLKRPLFLYVNEERFNQAAKSLVMFLIINEQGRKLLREEGFFSSFTLAPLYNAVERMSKR
ncbi:MAG: phosphate ABC transporter substrate-binding protein [Chitinispirillaceae bacterium]|nr:phosphate ABC transporter substrate-binding protein [Chitinispirillaceae bacterium]